MSLELRPMAGSLGLGEMHFFKMALGEQDSENRRPVINTQITLSIEILRAANEDACK